MDPAEDLQYAIEWYLESIPPASNRPPAPPPEPAAVETAISETEAAIAPLQLPGEVLWLWRTWDAVRFDPLPYPRLTDPAFALDCWRQNALESGHPRILFPVAYESHGFLLVELGQPEEPAPLWYHAYADDEYVLTYPSLASLFRTCAEAVEVTGVRPPADDNDRYSTYAEVLSGPGFDAIVERHLHTSPHAERDRRVPVGDVRRWPARWREEQNVDDDALAPLGATHTVAAFTAAAASGPTVARLVGMFHGQGGGSLGPGGTMATFGMFSDETGSIPVLLPLSVPDVGGRPGDVEVEIELEAYGPLGSPPDLHPGDIQDAALSGDITTASARAGDLARSLEDAAARMPVIRRMVPLR